MTLRGLHRRLSALLALTALLAFVSGAGMEAPSVVPTALLLLVGLAWDVPHGTRLRLEWLWRSLAVLLATRAGWHALFSPGDVVLPMVDLLFLLVLAESFRPQDGGGEARLYALTFALLIASAAYRPGFLFGVAFVLYLAMLTLTLIVGQLGRQTRARGLREPRLPGSFLLHSAALSGIALLVSGMVFVGFPRVSRGWATRSSPVVRNVIGFSDRVSLLDHGGRLYANPQAVLRAEFPDGQRPAASQLYWRGRSYDRFDGWSWSRSPRVPSRPARTVGWPPGLIRQVIYQASLADMNVLFGLSPMLRVNPHSRMLPMRDRNGDFSYAGTADPVYEVWSVAGQPSAAVLQQVQATPDETLLPYLRLPALSPRILALADSLGRGRNSSYERALAVSEWLRGSFTYTTELPATAEQASLEYFLFERRAGHCEYFSTAMAVLLRVLGVPTRNVNGFLGGEWNEFGDFVTVTQNQAHSWVEAWFGDYGWVRFDPTPAAAADAIAAAEHWWSPLSSLFAGVEHRWGKWVLDYDLEEQVHLLRRAGEVFSAGRPSPRGLQPLPWRTLSLVLLGGVLLAGALRHRPTLRRPARAAALSRSYLRLRRGYSRAGLVSGNTPPLRFVQELEAHNPPGAAAAAAAVRLYARVRFGEAGTGAGEDAAREVRRLVSGALRDLRRGKRTQPRA